jgi:hypothetical protein
MLPTTETNPALRPISLKTRILFSFLLVILVLSVPTAVLGYRVIEKNIIRRADQQVRDSINAAQIVYTGEIERIGEALKLMSPNGNVEALKSGLNVHYLQLVARQDFGGAEGRAGGGYPDHHAGRTGRDAGRVPGQGPDRDQADAEGATDR